MQTAERAVFSTARENADTGLGSLSLVLKNATFLFLDERAGLWVIDSSNIFAKS
jgi:hypothetical protein